MSKRPREESKSSIARPNYHDVDCCSFCKHDGSYFSRCGNEYINRCDKHDEWNSPTGICDDYKKGEQG